MLRAQERKLKTTARILTLIVVLGLTSCLASPAEPDQGQRDNTAKQVVQAAVSGNTDELVTLSTARLTNRKAAAEKLVAQAEGLATEDYNLEYASNGPMSAPDSVTVTVKNKALNTQQFSFAMGWDEQNGQLKWWLIIGDQNTNAPKSSPATTKENWCEACLDGSRFVVFPAALTEHRG